MYEDELGAPFVRSAKLRMSCRLQMSNISDLVSFCRR